MSNTQNTNKKKAPTSSSPKLLTTVLETVESIGSTNKVIKILKGAAKTHQKTKLKGVAKEVVHKVSHSTGISTQDILHSSKQDDNIKIARLLAVRFCIEQKMTFEQIGLALHKTKKMISNYNKFFNSCKIEKPKVEFDKKISFHYQQIQIALNNNKQ